MIAIIILIYITFISIFCIKKWKQEFAKQAKEICTYFDVGIEKYKKENPDSYIKIKLI